MGSICFFSSGLSFDIGYLLSHAIFDTNIGRSISSYFADQKPATRAVTFAVERQQKLFEEGGSSEELHAGPRHRVIACTITSCVS
jgi:hypothetical protein